MSAVLILREYKPAYDALVEALERGGTLGDCIFAIEKAARENNLGPLAKPHVYLTEKAGNVSWSKNAPNKDTTGRVQDKADMPPAPVRTKEDSLKALKEYKASVEARLREVEEKLNQLE